MAKGRIAILCTFGILVLVAIALLAATPAPAAQSPLVEYWKEPWFDYAPSGLPDFDQKHDSWGSGSSPGASDWRWTYCGPVAAANSLWWYDSKFETVPQIPSATTDNDHYPLVQSYGQWDDHWPDNVMPLVNELAAYFGTDPNAGTDVYGLYYGLQQYLYDHSLYDDYLVTLAVSPTIEWVIDEVTRSEDVILLLGFWQWHDPPGEWVRFGGHYVTVAGVDPDNMLIALSDPYADWAEQGFAGRVLSGTLIPHTPLPGHGPAVHNDAGNISHDQYIMASPSPSPGGVWWLSDYLGQDPLLMRPFEGINPHPSYPSGAWDPASNVHVEVEFAIAMSPFIWKPGEWVDYAPSCMPDFSQKQDNWQDPTWGTWSYCGPVAVANSLWWFDSKFEPNPIPPPTINDNYPLVQAYGQWDDHDPINVETQTPTIELIDDLAAYMQTGVVAPGTIITDLVQGTINYITDHGLIEDYTVTQVHRPEWDWVVAEVSRCEDVTLLLGFWQFNVGDLMWYRLGGHYVTVAGVDPIAGLVGFADPYFDQAELGWPWLGRVFPPGGHPPHPGMIPDLLHNDAALLSHDVYHAVGSPSPGGVWGPAEYPASLAMANFEWLNGSGPLAPVPGPPPPDPSLIYTEVEWAMAVSPLPPDLAITKTVTPTGPLLPGDWLTYTLIYTNPTSHWVESVVVSDILPAELINATFTYTTTFGKPISATGRYTWEIGRVGYQEGGVITIYAQVDPTFTDPQTTLTNEVQIGGLTPERSIANNRAAVTVTVQTADVWATKSGPTKIPAGQSFITYTVHLGNNGPASASNVMLVDRFPISTTFGSDNSGLPAAPIGGGRRWSVGTLTGGATASFVLTLNVPLTLPAGTQLTNTLTITTATPDRTTANNEDKAAATVVGYVYLPIILKH